MITQKDLEIIKANTVSILPEGELEKKLSKDRPLKIKLGMDPTSPDLHLGHAVVLSKLKEFQDMGHHVIFLIGDFTARIGDPTGKSKTRPPLSSEDIEHNMKTYFDQVSKILDRAKIEVKFNAQWLGALSSQEIVRLCANVTLARLTEREDFDSRIKNNQPIGFHELLYPLFQGYDSVALQADIELGGTDQTFNLLMGRYIQEHYNQEPQVIMTMPLLIGLDGTHKMSKSLGNAIGLTEPSDQAFGKLMSISDLLMWHYFKVLLGRTDLELSALEERVAAGNLHPMELKKDMAFEIILKFWSLPEAEQARKAFEDIFQKKDYSHAQPINRADFPANMWIADALKKLQTAQTTSQAKRLIEDGAVSINEQKIEDFKATVTLQKNDIIKVGKHRIFKVE